MLFASRIIPNITDEVLFLFFVVFFVVGVISLFFLKGLHRFIKKNLITKEICFQIPRKNKINADSIKEAEYQVSKLILEIMRKEFKKTKHSNSILSQKTRMITHESIIKKLFRNIQKLNGNFAIYISGQHFFTFEEFQKAVQDNKIKPYVIDSNFKQLIPFLTPECLFNELDKLEWTYIPESQTELILKWDELIKQNYVTSLIKPKKFYKIEIERL